MYVPLVENHCTRCCWPPSLKIAQKSQDRGPDHNGRSRRPGVRPHLLREHEPDKTVCLSALRQEDDIRPGSGHVSECHLGLDGEQVEAGPLTYYEKRHPEPLIAIPFLLTSIITKTGYRDDAVTSLSPTIHRSLRIDWDLSR